MNDTVVITQENQTSEKQLVAYVTAKQGMDVAETQLNDYLNGVLPSYMIPGFYITLDQLPLTGNGKLDYAALPVPSNDRVLAGAIIAPVKATEKQLQSIWRALLGIVALGVIVASVLFGFELGTWFSVGMVAFAGAAILYDTSNVLHHYPEDRYVAGSLHLCVSVALMGGDGLRRGMSRD